MVHEAFYDVTTALAGMHKLLTGAILTDHLLHTTQLFMAAYAHFI